jgi:hypothetical protein
MKNIKRKCESCINSLKVGKPNDRWLLCKQFDLRMTTSTIKKNCKFFKHKKINK